MTFELRIRKQGLTALSMVLAAGFLGGCSGAGEKPTGYADPSATSTPATESATTDTKASDPIVTGEPATTPAETGSTAAPGTP
ncbi:MAG: hypothetical protein K8F91_00530, partial [Candidatus Obscuribacterales bacterium]|nr:hypothetical protein [Candidatus Obscuribacterales bacterium]